MLEIQLNNAKLIFNNKDNGLDLTYSLDSSSIDFDLCKDEVSLLLDWCKNFPCENGAYLCNSVLWLLESTSELPLILINKDGYKVRINLTKCDLINISNYIKGE